MAEITLTRGKVALVDDEDFAWLSQYEWYAALHFRGKRWSAARSHIVAPGKRRILPMSREIMGLAYGDPREVDHLNFNTLDNQRVNLQIVSAAENKRRQPGRDASSQYVGVSWDASRRKWQAGIKLAGRAINLGRFDSEVEAATARDDFVLENATGHTLNRPGEAA